MADFLIDEEDLEIVMHCLVHFGGRFSVMHDYYKKGGKGAFFELARIERLAQAPHAENLLTDGDREKVEEALTSYEQLRGIYEVEDEKNPHPRLIADLILSEEEEEEAAIKAIVEKGSAIIPELVELLKSERFADPLFPGYGEGPALAARCLGAIGDQEATIPLFEAVGREATDEEATAALVKLNARDFLLKIIQSVPATADTERAASILSSFERDEETARICREQLDRLDVRTNPVLVDYLRLCFD